MGEHWVRWGEVEVRCKQTRSEVGSDGGAFWGWVDDSTIDRTRREINMLDSVDFSYCLPVKFSNFPHSTSTFPCHKNECLNLI